MNESQTYMSIKETASALEVPAYVLRYWENEFPQLSPKRGKGNRRYFQQEDMVLLRRIKKLLHTDGLHISKAREVLNNKNTETIISLNLEEIKKDVKELKKQIENLLQD